MAKKIGQLLISSLFLILLGACTQTAGDEPAPSYPPVAEPPGREIEIDWVQYDVYTKDFLYGGNYTEELMIKDFMRDNLAIPDIPTAKRIIDDKSDPWTVPPYPFRYTPIDTPIDTPETITITWTAYDAYLESLSAGGNATWDAMIEKFMKDDPNNKIRDIATATFLMEQQAYFKINVWNQYVGTSTTGALELNWAGYNSKAAWAKKIMDFMRDNTNIQDVATAEFIVRNHSYFKDNDWIEYARAPTPPAPGTLIHMNWFGYNSETIRTKQIMNFMRDNPAIPDISTAEYIIQEKIDPWTMPLTELSL